MSRENYQEFLGDPETWQLHHTFRGDESEIITCGKSECTLGSYVVYITGGERWFPGCGTCKFGGGLTDVFDPEKPRYVPNAPEAYKVGAAKFLSTLQNVGILEVMKSGRSEAVAMIEEYAQRTMDQE